MKILDFLRPTAIKCSLQATDKKAALAELTELLAVTGDVPDKDRMVQILLEREALGSTGIGQGIAIPHGKHESIKQMSGAFGISRRGVRFDALDGELVYIFFLLVAPHDSAGPHLKALARISRILKDKGFRQLLMQSKDEKEILQILREEDERKD